MNILIEKLKNLVIESKEEGRSDLVIINAIKEYLQYPILHFIYNHPTYSSLVMYGGTLLRIAYDLNRMSEDIDFQTDKKFDLEAFKKDIINSFKKNHGVDIEVTLKTERMTGTDQAIIKFPFLKELGSTHSWTVLKLKVDINNFLRTNDFTTETIPIVKDTYVFSIKTYPLATLMASKVAAVFLRDKRDIGDKKSDCKPRDIYDLMWYMDKKTIPNMEYIKQIHSRSEKPFSAENLLDLFDQLELRILELDDHAFEKDLGSLFYDPARYEDWHRNWKERFQMLRKSYEIYSITQLESIHFSVDFSSGNRHFLFRFLTDEPQIHVKFTCSLSEYWFEDSDLEISAGHRRRKIEPKVTDTGKMSDLEYEYMGLFYEKIEDYLTRNKWIVTQRDIQTKSIRATGDRLNIKTQVVLNRRLLEKCKFEDLL